MIDVLLALSWAGLVLGAATRAAPAPIRARARCLRPGDPRPARSFPMAVVSGLGAVLLRSPSPPDASLRLGRAVLAALATSALVTPAAPVVAGLVWAFPMVQERRQRCRARAALIRDLPEVADLFVLAVGSGLTVPLAVDAVARRAPEAFDAELRSVMAEVALGQRLSDALEDVPRRLGEEARPLFAALVASDRYGAPLLEGLERLGVELRNDRRRRAEEAARRVPVKLLFPLVFCTLPAFALLTVAPLLAGALGALRL